MSVLGTTLAAILSTLACTATAQTCPAKPIRMAVPWPPGGTNDILGRAPGDGYSISLVTSDE